MNFKVFNSKYGNIRFLKGKDVFCNAEDVAKILGFYSDSDYVKILLKYIKATHIKQLGGLFFIDSLGLEMLMSRTTTENGIRFREWYLTELLTTLENPIGAKKKKAKKKKQKKRNTTKTKVTNKKYICSGGHYYVSVERTFLCRQCGVEVVVSDPKDKRSVFCRQKCEKEYWKHQYREKSRRETLKAATYTNGEFMRKLYYEKKEAEEFRNE